MKFTVAYRTSNISQLLKVIHNSNKNVRINEH